MTTINFLAHRPSPAAAGHQAPETFALPKSYWALALVLSIAISIASLLTACEPVDGASGGLGDSDAQVKADGIAAKQLVHQDVEALADQPNFEPLLQSNDLLSRNYKAVFGGFTATDTLKYFNTRIHYYVSQYDIAHAHSDSDTRTAEFRSITENLNAAANTIVGATNIGVAYWLMGVYYGDPLTLNIDNQSIQATTSRVGIMLIGPGYNYRVRLGGGKVGPPPMEARQATLIHEARHSDCTGGIQYSTVLAARKLDSPSDFVSKFVPKTCGHLHAICPDWHELHGAAGCDDLPWGAYAVENLYENATVLSARASGDYVRMATLRIAANDSQSRLLYIIDPNDYFHTPDIQRLWTGEFGAPDMSSTGVLNQW